MQRNNPWQSYRKISVQTASPGHLILMLYEGAIRFLEQSLTGFELKDPLTFNQTINNNIHRAQAIITELNSALDMRKGGEISLNFRRLYAYMERRLIEANIQKKREPIEEILMRLRVLRDSWAEMLQKGGAEEARAQAAEMRAAEMQTA